MSHGAPRAPSRRNPASSSGTTAGVRVFTVGDLEDLAGRGALSSALTRMTRSGAVLRLDRGIYFVQRIHPRFGPMWPSADLVVMAVARRTGGQIKMAGPQAANMSGLSTQVPARAIYITDGRSRSVTIHNLVVEIRHAGRVEMLLPGTAAGVFITALLYLGKGGFSESLLRHRLAALSASETALLRSVRGELPVWMRGVIDRLPDPA